MNKLKKPTFVSEVDYIKRLLLLSDEACRDVSQITFSSTLFQLLRLNKMERYASHFQDCKLCRNKVSERDLKKLLVLQKILLTFDHNIKLEKGRVYKKLKSKSITPIELKNSDNFDKLKRLLPYKNLGTDLDLLVDLKDIPTIEKTLQSDYEIDHRTQHEITFVHKNLNVKLDFHFLVALPREQLITKEKMEKITLLVIKHARKNSLKLSLELYFFTAIIRFWCNDLATTAKTLFEIFAFVSTYLDKKTYSKIDKFARKFSFSGLVRLTIWLSIFSFCYNDKEIKKYEDILPKPGIMMKLIINFLTMEKISVFNNGNKFWDNTFPQTKQRLDEIYFMKLLTSESISLLRLMRPRILYFIIKLLLAKT